MAFECLALVQQLVAARAPSVNDALVTGETLSYVFDILFAFPRNNLAHARIAAILELILGGNERSSTLCSYLLDNYKLGIKVASAIKKEKKRIGAGLSPLLGPLYAIALRLDADPKCQQSLESSKRWQRFLKRYLLPHKEQISTTHDLHRENSYVDEERGELWNKTQEQFTFLISEQ